jgi:hypothetical protein
MGCLKLRKKLNLKKSLRYGLQGLTLAGIMLSSFFPISTFGRQFLMLLLLVWFQATFLYDIFFNGK